MFIIAAPLRQVTAQTIVARTSYNSHRGIKPEKNSLRKDKKHLRKIGIWLDPGWMGK
jgi:hypothetical protein